MTIRSAPLVALVVIVAAACGASSTRSSMSTGGGPAIVSVQQVDSQTRGHPTVLLFTAQGCASCEADARALQGAAGGRSDVRLVGVDMDGGDAVSSLAGYVRAIGLQSSSFVWTIDGDGTLARRYGITDLSSTVFLDSSGRVRFVNQGPQDAGTYSGQLSQLR